MANTRLYQEHGYITFDFTSEGYVKFGALGLIIHFNGWTNDPNPTFTLDEETAIQIALDFALHDEKLNKSHGDGGKCEYLAYERFPEHEQYQAGGILETVTSKQIISDASYYVIENGRYTYDPTNTGQVEFCVIVVDGLNGGTVYAALWSMVVMSNLLTAEIMDNFK